MALRTLAWTTWTLLALAPLAAAQDHGHDATDGTAWVVHDGPDSGRAVLGGLTHFGFLLIDKTHAPQVHRDAEFLVTQGGAVVFATSDAHEYDGHFSFDHVFTRSGPYAVTATSDKMATTVFEGVVVAPVNETVASIVVQVERAGPTNEVTVSIVDPSGAIIPHTDAIIELRFRGSGALASRLHGHIHEDPVVFEHSTWIDPLDMRIVAYKAFATGRSTDVRAIVAIEEFPAGDALSAPSLPSIPSPPPILEPTGPKATEGGFTLHTMFDPQNQVAAGNPLRLVGIFADKNGTPVPHVDFSLKLSGPRGLEFASETLHEYDGVLEHVFVPWDVGDYAATMTATYDDVTITVPMRAQALPPVLPLGGAGPGIVSVKGLDALAAGTPAELTFFVGNPATAIMHSEVDVTIFHDDEAPIYQFKLHTHDSGETKATVVFPHAGAWKVRVDPIPTALDPVVFMGPAGPDAPILFEATVEGVAADDDAAATTMDDAVGGANVPGMGVASALAVGAALAFARRRA